MFFANLGHQWKIASDVDAVRGSVVLASGVASVPALRRARPSTRKTLFDPQLYLAGLDATDCATTCRRLVTYPWFGISVPKFDSGAMTIRDWEKRVEAEALNSWPQSPPTKQTEVLEACKNSILFQEQFGCSHIILPTPLLREREDETTKLSQWLDASIQACEEIEPSQPLLATVAIDEQLLNDSVFRSSGLLDSIVDHVTVREGIDGVYIVIAQTDEGHPHQIGSLCRRAYMYLCSAFSDAGAERIMTNFADIVGQVCLGLGADDFATGASQKNRRLWLGSFRDREGGAGPFPRYYSRRSVTEYFPEADLATFDRKTVRRIADATPYSEGLIAALESGKSPSQLPLWAESRGNVSRSYRHFLYCLAAEGRRISRIGVAERADAIRDWLDTASLLAAFVSARSDINGEVAPVDEWLESFESVLE